MKIGRNDISKKQREWLQQIAYDHGGIGDLADFESEYGAMVAAAVYEECAKLCDEYGYYHVCKVIAKNIRARGKA